MRTADSRKWWEDAACAGLHPEIFFPEDGAGRPDYGNVFAVERAKSICRGCPVMEQCDADAMYYTRVLVAAGAERFDHGIFAARTPEERIAAAKAERARRARVTVQKDTAR